MLPLRLWTLWINGYFKMGLFHWYWINYNISSLQWAMHLERWWEISRNKKKRSNKNNQSHRQSRKIKRIFLVMSKKDSKNWECLRRRSTKMTTKVKANGSMINTKTTNKLWLLNLRVNQILQQLFLKEIQAMTKYFL